MFKRTVLFLAYFSFILSQAPYAIGAPPKEQEYGIAISYNQVNVEGLTGPYASPEYDKTVHFPGWLVYNGRTYPLWEENSFALYAQLSSSSNPNIRAFYLDVGAEIRRYFWSGYLGISINYPISQTLWINNWPTQGSIPIQNWSHVSPALVFGYRFTEHWTLRWSTIYSLEKAEFKPYGTSTEEAALFSTYRSILTLVYHFGLEEKEAAE